MYVFSTFSYRGVTYNDSTFIDPLLTLVKPLNQHLQIGFTRHAQNTPASTTTRSAGLRSFLARNAIPGRAASKTTAAAKVSDTSSTTTSSDSLEDLLGLNDVQRAVLQHAQQRARSGFTTATTTKGSSAAAKGSAEGSDSATENLQQMQGSQSAMTRRWWGSLDERVANSKQQLADAARSATSASGKEASMAVAVAVAVAGAAQTAAPPTTASGSSDNTVTAPYLGPDVPPPVISLSELDAEVKSKARWRLAGGVNHNAYLSRISTSS